MKPSLKEAIDLDTRITDLQSQLAAVCPEPIDEKLIAKEKQLDKVYFDLCKERENLDKKIEVASAKACDAGSARKNDQDEKALAADRIRGNLKSQINALKQLFNTALIGAAT